MQISSPIFYFVLWPLLYFVASAISSVTGWGDRLAQPVSGDFYPALDGLRGILALNVFFHHALVTYYYFRTGEWGPPASNFYAQMGPVSVTMFFFTTGFLFWTKLIGSPRGPAPGRFWVKRLRRVMPAYLGSLLVILAITAYQCSFHLLVPLRELALEIGAWTLCGVPLNFSTINAYDTGILNANVFWSLRIEWAFYLVLPFLGWFATKKRVFSLFLLSAAMVGVFRFFGQSGELTPHPTLVRTLANMMMKCFSVGILAAHLKAEKESWPALKHPACTAGAGLLLLGVLFLAPPKYGFLESVLLAPIFVMVIYGNDFYGLLTSRPIAYLGAISYSVYLWHGVVLYTVTQTANRYIKVGMLSPIPYWIFMGLTGGLVIFCASLSHRFLELSFMGRSKSARIRPAELATVPTAV